MKPAHAILLVEDNPADVKITQRAIKDSGLSVELIVVRDGQEAVEYLLRQGAHAAAPAWRSPDLVLLDMNLPRLDGAQVLERMRSVADYRLVPVVVLTTSKRQEDVARMYAAGANTYIQKPADFPRIAREMSTRQA
ncbi:MAG: response regulator [Gemmataceae bacterium]|nr:response regulator [Gemmataceae bacterium]